MEQQEARAFWTKQFANVEAEPFPRLPSSNYTPRPSQSVEHNIEGLGWDSSAFKPSVFIRLAWAILQSRYTNCNDVLFGAAAGVNGTAFPNRVQLKRDETVWDALRSLQTQAEQMAVHSRVDYTSLIQDGSDEAEIASSYKTLLVLTSTEARPQQQQRERRRKSLVDLYALTMECTISLSGLWVRFVHDPAILSNEQVERMQAQLGHILRQILMQPQSHIGDISAASEEDLQDIWSWNEYVTEAVDVSMTSTLAKATAAHSDALAVEAWDGKLTYGQLDELSTRLAFHLAAAGVAADTIVPLCFEKSMWTSVAMMAVVKAGAASMCLNARYPAEYLRRLVNRSQPAAVLCSPGTARLAAQVTDHFIVTLSNDFFAKLNVEPLEPLPAAQPSSRLCVIPTFGNSLVALTHSNFVTALVHQTRLFEITNLSRIYDLDSYNSDLIWLNHFLAFTNGACLCVPSDEERKGDLAESLSQFQASVLITTASSAQNIDLSQAIDLQTLVVCGETTPKLELPPHVRLISGHGVPECTILATYATEQQVMTNSHCLGRVPAGNAWVVSTFEPRELCAVGETGELWLESPLVGAGYVDDEKRTQAYFVNDPGFLTRGGPDVAGRNGRLYRTGDLVRYMPDGSLDFVGYRDPYITKTRGQRIDLTEIESEMRRLLGGQVVDVAAQVISPQGQPAPVLAAFLVPAGDVNDSSLLGETVAELAETLMVQLKQTLPSRMLPVVFLPIRSLPRMDNGELNRKRLRYTAELKSHVPENRTAIHAIRPKQAMTILEVQLQQLWAQVLGITDRSSITANSNWMELGGDESAATRLANAAQNWGLEVSAADILAQPRLADMAERVKHFHRASIVAPEGIDQPWSDMRRGTFESDFGSVASFSSAVAYHEPSSKVDRRRSSILVNGKEELPPAPMALTPVTAMQRRFLLGSVNRTPVGTEYYAFDVQSSLDPVRAIEACRKLCQHFDVLRTIFVQVEDAIYQTILPEVDVPMEVQQVTNNSSLEEISLAVITKDSQNFPVTLGRTFLRIYILHNPSTSHLRIILRTNQAYTDEKSISILNSALSTVLAGRSLFAAPQGQQPSSSSSHMTEASKSYWRNLLLGSTMSFIPRSSTSQTQPTRTISVSSIFTLPTSSSFSSSSTPSPSIPPPQILFTASCALLFSRISGSTSSFPTKAKEVLFGHIFSPPPSPPFSSSSSPTSTIGSNKILIPIRCRISNPASSSYEIIRQIQEQFSAGKAFYSGEKENEGFDFAMVANDNCYVRDCRGKIEKGDFGAVGEWVEDFSVSTSAASAASADGGSGSGSGGNAGTVKLLRPSRGKKNPIGTSTSTSTSTSNEELEELEELELERSNAVYIKAIPLPLSPTQNQQNYQQQQKIQIQISARSDVHSQQKLSEMLKILNEIWEKMGREGLVTGSAIGMGMGRGENKRKISMAEGFF